jgi:hypothetical protein
LNAASTASDPVALCAAAAGGFDWFVLVVVRCLTVVEEFVFWANATPPVSTIVKIKLNALLMDFRLQS